MNKIKLTDAEDEALQARVRTMLSLAMTEFKVSCGYMHLVTYDVLTRMEDEGFDQLRPTKS